MKEAVFIKMDKTPGVPNPIDIHVGERIRLRRTLLGISQEKLGSAIGITFQQVQKYEKGLNRVGSSRLWSIAQVLNTPVSFFFEDMNTDIFYNEQQTPEKLEHANPIKEDIDPMHKTETLELVRHFYKISNPKAAELLLDLVKIMANKP